MHELCVSQARPASAKPRQFRKRRYRDVLLAVVPEGVGMIDARSGRDVCRFSSDILGDHRGLMTRIEPGVEGKQIGSVADRTSRGTSRIRQVYSQRDAREESGRG
jgi:hypothetical protein